MTIHFIEVIHYIYNYLIFEYDIKKKKIKLLYRGIFL